jgi:hypothetical protein
MTQLRSARRHDEAANVRRAGEGFDAVLDLAGIACANRADIEPK